MKKKNLAKSSYRFRKQWNSIISSLQIPENMPLKFAKNINISLNDRNIIVNNEEEFKKQINFITENDMEIKEINLELNYQKIIELVEKQYKNLTSGK
jgi:hypothetical protein